MSVEERRGEKRDDWRRKKDKGVEAWKKRSMRRGRRRGRRGRKEELGLFCFYKILTLLMRQYSVI